MTGKTILLVEDNPKVMRNNKTMLKSRGATVLAAGSLAQARNFLSYAIDAAVIDLMLPDGSGLDLLKEIRSAPQDATYDVSTMPVLLLTAMGEPSDIVNGLSCGADDYLPKPYDLNVLAERINALLRRTKTVADNVSFGSLNLDIITGKAFYSGKDLFVTQKEFALLFLLVQNKGRQLSSKYLYEKVWGLPIPIEEEADAKHNAPLPLRVHISNLKKKLSDINNEIIIDSSRGEGYSLKKA